MNIQKPISLEKQLSKKILSWIFLLVILIIVILLNVTYSLSKNIFEKQILNWNNVIARYSVTSLVDSDDSALIKEVNFIKSTGLFSAFGIMDKQKRMIADFGDSQSKTRYLFPIKDENTKDIWGYYYFETSFYKFISPLFLGGGILVLLIFIIYFIIRALVRANLKSEFNRFNVFLNEIEKVTETLHEIYDEDALLQIDAKQLSSEQVIINKSILRLLNEIKKSNVALKEAISAAEQRRFQEELNKTALRVIHDICSPLAIIERIVQTTSAKLLEEERVGLRNAAGRIRDITNTLFKKAKLDIAFDEGPITQQLLQSLINQVVSEKRLQYGQEIKINMNYDNLSYHLFSFVRVADFCSVISNIINNAIEAIKKQGEVSISLIDAGSNALIKIQDNGKGISAEILQQLGNKMISYGKDTGHGIGLYNAKKTIENWNGNLKIESKAGEGTLVQIWLPKAQLPIWFVPGLKIASGQNVIVIDDDPCVHDMWKSKLRNYLPQINLIHLSMPDELIAWHEKNGEQNNLYLCDYEFIGWDLNGIDLLHKLQIFYVSILVTGRMTRDVLSQCIANRIKLLPKDMISSIVVADCC